MHRAPLKLLSAATSRRQALSAAPRSPTFIGCGGGRSPTAPPSLSTPLQVRRVLKLLETPYGGEAEAEAAEPAEASEAAEETGGAAGRRRSYSSKPPLWAAELCVT